jgi:hypothetical protein
MAIIEHELKLPARAPNISGESEMARAPGSFAGRKHFHLFDGGGELIVALTVRLIKTGKFLEARQEAAIGLFQCQIFNGAANRIGGFGVKNVKGIFT